MNELDMTRKVLAWLNSLPGCVAERRSSAGFGRRGEPDISCCYRGWCVQIELKMPFKQPRPIQVARMNEWKAAGAVVAVCHSLDDVKQLIRSINADA